MPGYAQVVMLNLPEAILLKLDQLERSTIAELDHEQYLASWITSMRELANDYAEQDPSRTQVGPK